MSFANDQRPVFFTALLGGRDQLNPQPGRDLLDWVCFSDQFSAPPPYRIAPFRDHLSDPRRSSREPKIRAHLYVPEAEISIWHDANIQFLTIEFIEEILLALKEQPIAFSRHPERDCAYREAEWCIKAGKDSEENIARTVTRLRAEGHPERAGLLNGGLIARRNKDPQVIRFNEIWWDLYSAGSERDQITLVHALNKAGLKPAILDSNRLEPPHSLLHPHLRS